MISIVDVLDVFTGFDDPFDRADEILPLQPIMQPMEVRHCCDLF